MHKVSRSLLLAGVLAFGALTTACEGDQIVQQGIVGVQSVTLTPPSATITSGSTIQLAVSVVADASTAKTVSYTTSSAAVATVDATGKVTGVGAGTATIIATSTADASKAAASVITVTGPTTPGNPNPSIAINSVTDVNGAPVTLNNVNGQINVTVNTSGGGLIEVFLSTACGSNTIGAADVAVASQQATSAQAGTVTLSFNTAQLTAANQARFANGNYCIKTRLTNGASVVVATNTIPLTLNNANVFNTTLAFASQTGGPTTAISSVNGLNYNQGSLTATITPAIFTSSSPVVLISGYLTLGGEMNGVNISTTVPFANIPVTGGVATVAFSDTSLAGVRSIYKYTSDPSGDNLVINSATDAAGNPVQTTPVTASAAVRIDNDNPVPAAYTVTAPNGFIGAAYLFPSGTTGTSTDTKGGVQGVGGVTTTYYVGAAGSAAFTTANSCDITGLNVANAAADLPNTTANNADQAKVIVKDALGNSICLDVASSFAGGLFGVDKIAPLAAFTTAAVGGNTGVADQTGYNATTRGFNFTFSDSISGFPLTAGSSPFKGTLKRVTSAGTTCVIGNIPTTGACADTAINTTTAPTFVEITNANGTLTGGFQFTNGTNVIGYYTANLTITDVASNNGPTITRTAAFDNVGPAVLPPTSPAAVPLSSVVVTSAATDNFNLLTSRGNLIYGPITFARVTGSVLGSFGQFITSANAAVTLTNVYRGMQDGSSGTITAAITTPTATVTVTDVGANSATSTPAAITTTTTAAAIFVGNTLTLTSSATSSATATATTTNLTFQVGGLSADPAFQSQPFAAVDIYKLNTTTGEYALVVTATAAQVVDNTTTGARTFTYTVNGVALNGGPATGGTVLGGTNTFIAVGRNAAGDAVRSPAVTQTNP